MAKILLVEDNEMNRDMLSRRLERRGHHLIMAEDGAVGVALACGCNDYETKPVDLAKLLAKIDALLQNKGAS